MVPISGRQTVMSVRIHVQVASFFSISNKHKFTDALITRWRAWGLPFVWLSLLLFQLFDVVLEEDSRKFITVQSILQSSLRMQTIICRISTVCKRLCFCQANVMQRGSFENRAARRNRRSIVARQHSYIRSGHARCHLRRHAADGTDAEPFRIPSRRLAPPRVVVN